MKLQLTAFISIFFIASSFAQIGDNNATTIDVQGYSKMLINSDNYVAQILIQEEEQKVGYTTIGKLSIDSVKVNLFSNLKKFGIDEKDLKILTVSSKEIPQYPSSLINISYEIKLKNKEVASKLVNEMRFIGLKGIVVKKTLTKAQKDALADSLYSNAVEDAKRIATTLARKVNKMIGEVKSIEVRSNTMMLFGMDADTNGEYYNPYGITKFEMDYRDKFAACHVRVIFELK